MKQDKYNIDYFLQNPYFISWVKQPTPESDMFWKKWLQNHPKEKESFYHAKAVINRVNFKVYKDSKNRREDILANILKDEPSSDYQEEKHAAKPIVKFKPWVLGSVAASFLLLIAFNFFYKNFNHDEADYLLSATMVTTHNLEGERTSFYLPDSTKVFLNAGSTLTYPSQFNSNTREVTLEGEAYFDVTHNAHKKFMVKSGELVTTVHGTAFNIYAYKGDDSVSIALERGLVAVHSTSKETTDSFYLHPGQELQVDKDFEKSKRTKFDALEVFGWKDGILVFKNANLDTMIAKLERWYGVEISVVGQATQEWQLYGSFKNQSLESVLQSLEFTNNINYEINNSQITIFINQNK